jgi:hypothetical protein
MYPSGDRALAPDWGLPKVVRLVFAVLVRAVLPSLSPPVKMVRDLPNRVTDSFANSPQIGMITDFYL